MKERLKAWGGKKIINIVSAVVINDEREILLLRRHALDLGGGKWGTIGGRIDVGESAITAVQREFTEETGIEGATFTELGRHMVKMPHGTVRMDSFLASLKGEHQIVVDPEEHEEYRWFRLEELLLQADLLWAVPTVLRDFGILEYLELDPTLADGSTVEFLGPFDR